MLTQAGSVAKVALHASDIVYSIQDSLAQENPFTRGLRFFSEQDATSIPGRFEVIRANTDPFLSVLAEAQRNQVVSVTTVTDGFGQALHHLSKLSKLPVVIHVSLSSGSASEFSRLTALRSSGFTILQSFNSQEAYDLSIVAHSLALSTGHGILHFFVESQPSETTTHILEKPQLFDIAVSEFKQYKQKGEQQEEVSSSSDKKDGEEAPTSSAENETLESIITRGIEGLFSKVQNIAGRQYDFFKYWGSPSTDTALIVFGSPILEFVNTIQSAKWGDVYAAVGVVGIRVYRPWNAEHLLNVIPKSVKNVGILSQANFRSTKWSPLFLDFVPSLDKISHSQKFAKVVDFHLGDIDHATVTQALRGVLLNIQDSKPVQGLFVGKRDDQPSSPSETAIQVPELENSYLRILDDMYKDNLDILNALDKPDIGISKSVSSAPDFGFSLYLANQRAKKNFMAHINKVVKDGEVSSDVRELLVKWLVNEKKNTNDPIVNEAVIAALENDQSDAAKHILERRALFTTNSSWLIGSDAWSYDLGNSGVHNVVASGQNINMLVIDSQPYSERSANQDYRRKKDIGLYALNYGNVYVASVAVYASYTQVLQAFSEAAKYPGPSVIVAYLPYETETDNALKVLKETKVAVDSGYWPLYRWDPSAPKRGEEQFQLDSPRLKKELKNFLDRDNFLSQLALRDPAIAKSISQPYGAEVAHERRRKAKEAYAKLLEGLSGPPVTILFASDGGGAEAFAKRLARRAKGRSLKSSVYAMDDYPVEDLPTEENIILISSTAGQGEIPQNGKNFWDFIKSSTDVDLANSKYAVFGMGDSLYWPRKQDKHYYNRPSKELDARFNILGGTRLIDLGLGDDQDPDGPMTAYTAWEAELWKALGVEGLGGDIDEPPPITNEDIKINSNYLRGTIVEGLADESTGAISANDQQLTKFHGIYLQDDRDVRDERKANGLEPAYAFMVRVRLPGCVSTPQQWLKIDELCDSRGNGTFKITTRGTFQLHGVIKKDLKPVIQGINSSLMDTIAACGDVNRNVMCSALPQKSALHGQVLQACKDISNHLLPQTSAYHEIWLTDQSTNEKKMVAGEAVVDHEPLYGPTYLPRKFKVSICIPPYNDVDVYAHDVGLIAIENKETGKLDGFNVLVGGGMGTTHNNKKTYPRTGSMFGYVELADICAVCEKIMIVQRDNGDRKNRKHARLKYTIDDMGVDVYKEKVQELWGKTFQEPREFYIQSNIDYFGWVTDEFGKHHCTLFIENGRVEDTPEFKMRTGLREIAKVHKGEFRLTGNQHVVVSNVDNDELERIKGLLKQYKLDNVNFSGLRKSSSSCVAFPTCGLAMAESERYLPQLITKLEKALEEYGLRHDSIVMRMTGCPNGCARPWMAEVALVGKAYGAYNLLLGGGYHGERLNKLYRNSINEKEILSILKPLFKRWSLERTSNDEHFGDFLIRVGVIKPTLSGKTFHDDVPEDA